MFRDTETGGATRLFQCENCGCIVAAEYERAPLWIGAYVGADDNLNPQTEPGCDSCSLERINYDL